MKIRNLLILFSLALPAACGGVQVDKELMSALKAMSANCLVDTQHGFAENCKNAENEKVKKLIDGKGIENTIGTIAVAAHSDDPKLMALSCRLSYSEFKDKMDVFVKNPKLLTKIVAKKFIQALKKQKEYAIFYCSRTAAHTAMLLGLENELFSVIENHPQVRILQREIYSYGMKYGRNRIIHKIKLIAESGDKQNKMSALIALRNFYNYTESEKASICDWVKQFNQDEDRGIARYSVFILAGRCKGKYTDMALDAAEKRARESTLDNWYVYDAAPYSCQSLLKDPEATPERCKRRAVLRNKVGIKD
jgi:hypothetical protein